MMLVDEFENLKKSGRKIASLTAYDYPTARLLDECGLDLILVGDSVGMVVLGYSDTTEVTLAEMIHHTRAVARGVKDTLVAADIPFGMAETVDTAIASAKALIDAGARAVKIEGGREVIVQIEGILRCGIPVIGHLGMLPQRIRVEGAYRIKGKTPQQADELMEDAIALSEAGVFAIVLELVSPPLAEAISRRISTPTIGIGSGEGCDGQILVSHDLIGLFPWFTPRFVRPQAQVAESIQEAARAYVRGVRREIG